MSDTDETIEQLLAERDEAANAVEIWQCEISLINEALVKAGYTE